MKQTAVEFLEERIKVTSKELYAELFEDIKQAKQMEKEQIEDAYEIGFDDGWYGARYDNEPKYAGAEQYYNETYEK